MQGFLDLDESVDSCITGILTLFLSYTTSSSVVLLPKKESQSLYEAYKKQYSSNPFAEGTLETGNKLIDTRKEEEMERGHHID